MNRMDLLTELGLRDAQVRTLTAKLETTADLAAELAAAREHLEAVRTRVKERLRLVRGVRDDAEASAVELRVQLAEGMAESGRPLTEKERAHLQGQLDSRRRLLARSDARVDELEQLAELV